MPLANLPHEALAQLNLADLELLKQCHFAVQIDRMPFNPGIDDSLSDYLNATVAGFTEVTGLRESVDVREISEGGYPGKHQFPRRVRTNAVTLVRGLAWSRSLYDWWKEVTSWTKGKPDYRRQVTIISLDQVRAGSLGAIDYEAWRWTLDNAWPSVWSGPHLNSNSDSHAVESITIRYQGIKAGIGPLSGTAGEVLSLFA